jgi:hypothetical protein
MTKKILLFAVTICAVHNTDGERVEFEPGAEIKGVSKEVAAQLVQIKGAEWRNADGSEPEAPPATEPSAYHLEREKLAAADAQRAAEAEELAQKQAALEQAKKNAEDDDKKAKAAAKK